MLLYRMAAAAGRLSSGALEWWHHAEVGKKKIEKGDLFRARLPWRSCTRPSEPHLQSLSAGASLCGGATCRCSFFAVGALRAMNMLASATVPHIHMQWRHSFSVCLEAGRRRAVALGLRKLHLIGRRGPL